MLDRCARPTLTARAISTYTICGFAGYAIANAVGAWLAIAWQLELGERLVAMLAPPLAFIVVVTIASALAGRELIVFYETALAGVIATAAIAALAGLRAARLVDVATIGIGAFLAIGRLGCFSVACCHGTLGRGVRYGERHVRAGLWARWEGRALWPVQLVEAGASAALVVAALAIGWDAPGAPAVIYIVGYAIVRFALELARGDVRPYALGVSEAQWLAAASACACAIWRPGAATIAAAGALACACAVLAATRDRRALLVPAHLRELDAACARVLADPARARRDTSRGVAVSCHDLPDGRRDWVISSEQPRWSTALARRIAHALWAEHEIVVGRTPGVVHVITPITRP